MPEVSRRVRIGKVLTFSIDGRIFGMLKNRLGMISGRNIKGMIFRRWLAAVPFVSCLSIMDSTRASRVKPRFTSFRIRESVWNVCLHARDNHLRYAFCTKRWVSDTEAIVIPWKIRIVPPKVTPLSRGIMPEAPPLRWVQWRNWSNKTGSRNKVVIGGAQRRV